MTTRTHTLLSVDEKARLRHVAEDIERETGAEIALLVVRHVDDLERFATAYFNHLGVGKREHDNGVLVLVVIDRRLIRIEVGRGLEKTVPPAAAQRIIDGVVAPHFRLGRYGDGVVRGMEALGHLIRAAQLASPPDDAGGAPTT